MGKPFYCFVFLEKAAHMRSIFYAYLIVIPGSAECLVNKVHALKGYKFIIGRYDGIVLWFVF